MTSKDKKNKNNLPKDAHCKNGLLKFGKELSSRMAVSLTHIVDWFYIKPLRKMVPLDTFRYALCGGSNLLLNLIIYACLYNFVLRKEVVDLGFVAISPYVASFLIAFPITFLTGFWLNRHIAFQASPLRGWTQLFRYGLSVVGSLVANYLLLKLFVEVIGFYPTPSQAATSILVTIYSYLAQRHFSFRGFKK